MERSVFATQLGKLSAALCFLVLLWLLLSGLPYSVTESHWVTGSRLCAIFAGLLFSSLVGEHVRRALLLRPLTRFWGPNSCSK